mmetsp:Transcript_15481/g.20439  ORF Transcript_15481/g.20439 Transcript_15481/m.20439 type:complete len:135 (-) Transcript_15481:360-764(-)
MALVAYQPHLCDFLSEKCSHDSSSCSQNGNQWFSIVPEQPLRTFFSFLDAEALTKTSQVDHFFREISSDDLYWNELLKKDFGVSIHDFKGPVYSAQKFYAMHYQRFREVAQPFLSFEELPVIPRRSLGGFWFGQ